MEWMKFWGDDMENFDLYDLVKKVNGSVIPSGDSAVDNKVKQQLNNYLDLHTMMLEDICYAAANDRTDLASVKEISDIARNYLSCIRDEIDYTLNLCSECNKDTI